jgi:propionyl-CoA synthetase
MGRNQLDEHSKSCSDPIAFWGEKAKSLVWHRPFDSVLSPAQLVTAVKDENLEWYKWFEGGQMNMCFNCLDRHVLENGGDRPAIVYDSPAMDPLAPHALTLSYSELLDEVKACAGVLQSMGLVSGDRVIIYMPMVPETVIAMLACARLGLVQCVVFGGFAGNELAKRIADAGARAIVTATFGIEPNRTLGYTPMVADAIRRVPLELRPEKCLLLDRGPPPPGLNPPEVEKELGCATLDWKSSLDEVKAKGSFPDCVALPSSHPLYLAYTSGSTGTPKGIQRDTAGYAVALKYAFSAVYGMSKSDVFLFCSDLGWVAGNSFLWGSLLTGCASIIFEGKPVMGGKPTVVWRAAEEHKVTTLFAAPTALRAIKKLDPHSEQLKSFNLSQLKLVLIAGEHCDHATLKWIQDALPNSFCADHCKFHPAAHIMLHSRALLTCTEKADWSTEAGWPVTAPCRGYDMKSLNQQESAGQAVPGSNMHCLDTKSRQVPRGVAGELALKLPLPPGALNRLWAPDDERFVSEYLREHRGYFRTGDAGWIDSHDYVYIMSRVDDVINVAAHRLTTAQIETVISDHPAIAEIACIGFPDDIKGEVPIGFAVLNDDAECDHVQIAEEVRTLVRSHVGAFACYSKTHVVPRLPKTRSGKTLRRCLRLIAMGKDCPVPATIEDAGALDDVRAALFPL